MKKIVNATGNALLWVLHGFVKISMLIAAEMIRQHIDKRVAMRREIERKVKYFKPTIHEGFFCKRITWEMRDKPLTKEEIDKL